MMQNELIKQMVERFLGWSLPENFNPDDGISFEPVANKGTVYEFKRQPTGTNLLDYTQAEAMVRYMVGELEGPSKDWCVNMARLEEGEIGAGAPAHPLRCPPLTTPATDSTELEARLRMHQSWRDSHGELNDAPNEAADAIASYRAETAQLRDKLARANHTAADLLQHVDWLTCGLPDLLENAALTDEEGLIGAATDAATSARQALKDTAHD